MLLRPLPTRSLKSNHTSLKDYVTFHRYDSISRSCGRGPRSNVCIFVDSLDG